jgi:glycosyltransferase involved in cell wall biosynthesis
LKIDEENSGKIDVVIPAYNAHNYIQRCLESVLSQTLKPNRVIIVDDGSSPPMSEALGRFGDQIVFVRLSRNSGVSAARNIGVQHVEGDYFAFLDSDDYWEPDFLKQTWGFLQRHPEVVAVSTGTRVKSWNGSQSIYPRYPYIAGEIPESGVILDNFFRFWAESLSVLTGTVLMRLDTAMKTGGMRPDFFVCEDLEFWGLLATYGSWGFIPQPLFVTDQRAISPRERLRKLTARYDSMAGMSMDSWGYRIRKGLPDKYESDFTAIEAYVATIFVVAHAYSLRFEEAWNVAAAWKPFLKQGLGAWLRLGVNLGRFTWPVFCGAVRMREIIKAYVF